MEPEKDMFEQWSEEFKNRPWYIKLKSKLKWFWEDLRYIPKEFYRGVSKIFYWLPIIWKDRDWDSHYIFEVLKHKLKAQARYISDRNLHTTAQQDARNMRICVSLIEKVQEEFYDMEYLDYQDLKTWFEPIDDQPGYSTWNSRIVEEDFDKYFQKYPLIYKRVLNGEGVIRDTTSKENIARNIAYINQQRAHKLLFKIMEEHIKAWWD